MARAEFQLEPLTCPSCAKKIETVVEEKQEKPEKKSKKLEG